MLVLLIQQREVLLVDIHLVGSTTTLNLRHERRYARTKIDEHIGLGDKCSGEVKNLHVCSKVARRDKPHAVQVIGKDVSILVDGAVLKNILFTRTQHVESLLNTATQKRDLQLKSPSAHILIEVSDIGIIALLVVGLRAITSSENLGKRSLSTTYISCNCYVHSYLFIYAI